MRRYTLTYLARCAALKVPPGTALDGDKRPPRYRAVRGHHWGSAKPRARDMKPRAAPADD